MTRQAKWQLAKEKAGLCTICGKRKICKGKRCRLCYERQRTREATRRRLLRKHGIASICD